MIAAVTAASFFQLRVWQTTAVFFAVMQIGAVVGAMWASRLKRKLDQHHRLLLR